MAITAKFGADFSSFQDATQQAEIKLAEFEGNSNKVGTSLQKMANSLSGTSIIQQATLLAEAVDRVGGVSTLTEKELARVGSVAQEAQAKLLALGQTVPPKIQEIADASKRGSETTAGWLPLLQEMGSSWVARVAEGILLRDAIRDIIGKVKDMAEALPELALKGAAIAEVEESFRRLTSQAGLLSDELLGTLRAGTHDTITDFELMKTVNRDLAAGMNLTSDQFRILADGAFALAKATGTDVKGALETMNDAMLTGRTRALALLTGKIDLSEAERKYAGTLGTTADRLTEAGKLEGARAAILDGISGAVGRLGVQTDGLDERVTQASTAWANFEGNLGKAIATSKTLESGMDGIKAALMDAFGSSQQQVIGGITSKIDEALVAVVGFAESGVTAAGFLVKEYYAVNKVFGDLAQIVSGDALAFEYLALGVSKVGAATSTGAEAQARYAADIERINGNISSLLDSMAARGRALQDDDKAQQGVSQTTAQYVALLEGLKAKMEAARADTVAFVGPLNQEADGHDKAGAAAKGHGEALVKEGNATRELAELESQAALAEVKQVTDSLRLQESARQADDARRLSEEQNRVRLGLQSEASYQADKLRIEFDGYQRHLENLRREEQADLQSNGIKLDGELAKEDERYAKGLVTKEEYEAQYAAIEAKYAAIRAGIEDAYRVHVNEALAAQQSINQKAQDAMVADWTASGLAANQYALGITQAEAAIEGNLQSQIRIVHDLAGEWQTAAEAKKAFDGGSTFTYDLNNREGVEQYRAMNTGMEITWSDQQIIDFAKKGGTLQDLMQMGVIHMKAFEDGGPTGDGGPALLHPDEFVVPKGGALVMGGGGGGRGTTPIVLQVVMDGRVVAEAVADHQTRSMLQERLWPGR